jgi:acyl carrier protein
VSVSTDIPARLAGVIEQTFDLPTGSAGPDAQLGQTPRWDSLGHIELILAIEAEFRVKIRTDHIRGLTTFAKLREHLEQLG